MPRRLLLVALALALAVSGLFALQPAQAAVATVRESGYITMRDGVQLHYTVERPASGGPVPVLFTYDGYDAGYNPDPGYINDYVKSGKGYALIGVSLRGSGCSGGVWDFFQPAEALDGHEVIEWVAQQPWSNGRVAMIGKSYPGITQLFVAATRPPHLVAIAPGHTYGDIYRDIAYPGGIFNYGFSSLWTFVAQPYYSDPAMFNRVMAGDETCTRHVQNRPQSKANAPFVQALQHQWDDDLIKERSPIYQVGNIEVPTWTVAAWQDEQVGPKSVDWIPEMKAPVYGIVTNGDHSMYRSARGKAELARFMDHFVKGVDNGFEDRPGRFEIWWDANTSRTPAFSSWAKTWPPPSRTKTFVLDAGTLEPTAKRQSPVGSGSDSFVYAGPTGSGQPNPRYGEASLPDHQFYAEQPRPPGTWVDYTTAPLTADLPLLGSASADLWISSTAPDTDLQVSLTEVRPDGQEVFVQQGWLRASHRALDPAKSTAVRPYQTHQLEDMQVLVPGQPTLARVEVFPFGHLFRAGSRLRLTVEAPKPLPDLWSFVALPVPGVTTVLHDALHPSKLVLSEAHGSARPEAPTPLPACGTLSHQPCR